MDRWSRLGFAVLLASLVFVVAAMTEPALEAMLGLLGAGVGLLLVLLGGAQPPARP